MLICKLNKIYLLVNKQTNDLWNRKMAGNYWLPTIICNHVKCKAFFSNLATNQPIQPPFQQPTYQSSYWPTQTPTHWLNHWPTTHWLNNPVTHPLINMTTKRHFIINEYFYLPSSFINMTYNNRSRFGAYLSMWPKWTDPFWDRKH